MYKLSLNEATLTVDTNEWWVWVVSLTHTYYDNHYSITVSHRRREQKHLFRWPQRMNLHKMPLTGFHLSNTCSSRLNWSGNLVERQKDERTAWGNNLTSNACVLCLQYKQTKRLGKNRANYGFSEFRISWGKHKRTDRHVLIIAAVYFLLFLFSDYSESELKFRKEPTSSYEIWTKLRVWYHPFIHPSIHPSVRPSI